VVWKSLLNDSGLVAYPGPGGNYMTDGFGGTFNDSYPYSCNNYNNMARGALYLHSLADSDPALATELATINAMIIACTGSVAPGGVRFTATSDPSDGFTGTTRPTFAYGGF